MATLIVVPWLCIFNKHTFVLCPQLLQCSAPAGPHWSPQPPLGKRATTRLKKVLNLTMNLWKMAAFAQIWLKKATTPTILGRILHSIGTLLTLVMRYICFL
jgi:hypothetical protein